MAKSLEDTKTYWSLRAKLAEQKLEGLQRELEATRGTLDHLRTDARARELDLKNHIQTLDHENEELHKNLKSEKHRADNALEAVNEMSTAFGIASRMNIRMMDLTDMEMTRLRVAVEKVAK